MSFFCESDISLLSTTGVLVQVQENCGAIGIIVVLIKQITTVGEGDGTNYHFRGDLDVAIFPKRS